jgi:uncharacterized protein involved in exopolysaccharide biosynthesis
MASQKQLLANRLNAQKSTGPRSDEGKARSSMNALKTGIDAKTPLIRGEISTALQELTGEYHGRFRPTTPEQRMLVDTLIDCEWLLRRFRAIETQLWERVVDIYDITLGHIFSERTGEFTRLQRRIDSTQRHYHNALNQLRRLQAEESAPEPDPEPAPQNQLVSAPNGFVPQTVPQPVPTPSAGARSRADALIAPAGPSASSATSAPSTSCL